MQSFRTLVTAGMRTLENTACLTGERVWHRLNKLGHVHANAQCHKYRAQAEKRAAHIAQKTRLSVTEVAKKKYCPSCCVLETLIGVDLTRTLVLVARLDTQLENSKGYLVATTNISTVGNALSYLHEAQKTLALISDKHADITAKALRAYQNRTSALRVKADRQFADIRNTLLGWTVQQICRPASESSLLGTVKEGSRFPGFQEPHLALFGKGEVNERNGTRDKKLVEIYCAWLNTRQQGADEAALAANTCAETSELVTVNQLCFPYSHPGGETDLSATAKEAWISEMRTVLTNMLFPLWEEHYTLVSNLTQPTLVGIDSILHNPEIHSILAAYPGYVLDTKTVSRCLILVPEAIAIWLQTGTHTVAHTQRAFAPAVTPEMLEMISALWAPKSADGAYGDIADAMKAVVALDLTTKTPLP